MKGQRLKQKQAVGGTVDMEFASMKYEVWKPKMVCGSCTENGNDVEVFLPCGHMICNACKDQIVSSRQRACPFDRRRFTEKEPKPVYWAGNRD